MKIVQRERRHRVLSYEHYKARRGEITSKRKPKKLIWQIFEGRVYITCKACSAINDITNHYKDILRSGHLNTCVICKTCLAHYFVDLSGLTPDKDGPFFCAGCKVSSRTLSLLGLKKKGWHVGKKKFLCPNCS